MDNNSLKARVQYSCNKATLIYKTKNLVDLLRLRSRHQADKVAYTFLVDGELESKSLTYSECDFKARAIGAMLESSGATGERVLLCLHHGLEYIVGFMGCLYAGAIAVPVFPLRLTRDLMRLQAIAESADVSIMLVDELSFARLNAVFSKAPLFKKIKMIAYADIDDASAKDWRPVKITDDTLALLQFTSGSTSAPKGVMISHGNLMHNEQMIQNVFKQSESSIIVSWLPFYHDMGLIGNVLQSLYIGSPCVFLSPLAFIQRPLRWLEAITTHRATTSGAPNFAFDLCVRSIEKEQCDGLDLSSWSVAYNGSEMIRSETLVSFTKAFKPYGFREEAFHPCYGLAEATLLVSGIKSGFPVLKSFRKEHLKNNKVVETHDRSGLNEEEQIQTLVSCGKPSNEQSIVIVNPESLAECLPDEIGEVWVASPSVSQGYYNCPLETVKAFRAHFGDFSDKPFLRTGDLGFVKNGELYITGRLKDLIIIRGSNYHSQDIEFVVEQCHTACLPHSGAAFSIEVDGEERLVIVQEVNLQSDLGLDSLIETIRREVAKCFDLQAYSVVLIKAGNLPKTTSGKIKRFACKGFYLNGNLKVIAARVFNQLTFDVNKSNVNTSASSVAKPESHLKLTEKYLQELVASILNIPASSLKTNQHLNELGVDSLLAAQIKTKLQNSFGNHIQVADFLQMSTISELAESIISQTDALPSLSTKILVNNLSCSSQAESIEPVSRDGKLRLSFDQERLWLLDQLEPGSLDYTIKAAIHLEGLLVFKSLKDSFETIIRRHEALRTSFKVSDGIPLQFISSNSRISIPVVDLFLLPNNERETQLQKNIAEFSSLPFNLATGPLIRASLIKLDDENNFLILNLHHIISDYKSIEIFIKELMTMYESHMTGKGAMSPDLAIQYVDYAHWQRLQEPNWKSQATFWKNRLAHAPTPTSLSESKTKPAIQKRKEEYGGVKFSHGLFDKLEELARKEDATAFMALFTALSILLYRYTSGEDILIGAPIDGRTRPEFTNMIGFFAYPLLLRADLSGNPTFRGLLGRNRKLILEAHANKEMAYAKVVEAARPARRGTSNPFFVIIFNYISSPIKFIETPNIKLTLSEVSGGLMNMQMFFTIVKEGEELTILAVYNRAELDPGLIKHLVESYVEILETCVRNPDIKLHQLKQVIGENADQSTLVINIASTFTAEPIKKYILFWMRELNLNAEIKFIQNQNLFQQLLTPASVLSSHTEGVNIILVRFEDFIDRDSISDRHKQPGKYLNSINNIKDLISSIKIAVERAASPYLVCLCPGANFTDSGEELSSFSKWMVCHTASELKDISNLYLITTEEIFSYYPVSNYYDSTLDTIARIPYTPDFFAALGTIIARKACALWQTQYKVIVLDCDQTIWKGYCGEYGHLGIELDVGRISLQNFMVNQHYSGMLLCLCSKNNEEDVFAVFDRCGEMVLKREHLVSWRINWKPKSENLRSLAEELQLGLDTFIFIDDSPFECEEVRTNCPEVLAILLPANPNDIEGFLKHVWEFDRLKTTDEGKKRTNFYKENKLREAVRKESLTIDSFLASLCLQIEYLKMELGHFARVAELTHRTNQFNFTNIKRTEREIELIYRSGILNCLVVNVQDRFGDLGLVGFMAFEQSVDAISVDTFILSCRALGKRVEHNMLAKLGEIAKDRGVKYVDVRFSPSKKNQPAEEFLRRFQSVCNQENEGTQHYRICTEVILQMRYESSAESTGIEMPSDHNAFKETAIAAPHISARKKALQIDRIATELCDVKRILKEVSSHEKSWLNKEPVTKRSIGQEESTGQTSATTTPNSFVEKALIEIWADILNCESVDINDNFYELGGHSLLAVLLISRVREKFNVEIPLISMFESPTIRDLAGKIEEMIIEESSIDDVDAILEELNLLPDEEVKKQLILEMNLNSGLGADDEL
jgi:FkbH-like protein